MSGIKRLISALLQNRSKPIVKVEIGKYSTGNLLQRKTIIITGGGKGIGKAIATKCVSEGAKVIITGRNEENLSNTAQSLGESCAYIVFDNRETEKIEDLFQEAESKFGIIDCLVCNAGISNHESNMLNVTIDGYDQLMSVNLKSTYFLIQSFIRRTIDNEKEKNIVVISSETGDMASDIPYGISKASLNSLVKGTAYRYHLDRYRVNAIAPGVTLTDMTKGYANPKDDYLFRDNIAGRYFLPEEIAEVACFLLSTVSSCINGEIIHCNGGNHIRPYWKG